MANGSSNSSERKNRTFSSIVIEPFKQMKFGVYMIAISLVFVVMTAVLFVVAFSEQYKHVMGIFSVVDPDMQWELVTNDVFIQNAWRIALLLVSYVAILMVVVFKLTHRYYGPLVSIERFIGHVSRGEYGKRVSIRNKDELQRLVGKLNDMADLLERRHGPLVDEEGNRIERRGRRGRRGEDSEDEQSADEPDQAV